MAGTGPAPKADAQRRRRNPTVAMTKLPAQGREGPPPEWPLRPDVTARIMREQMAVKIEQLQTKRDDATNARARNKAEADLDAAMVRLSVLEAEAAEQAELEAIVWAELWASPQAVAWERLRYFREVAQYVRWKVAGELGSLKASAEARQLGDRLGLTPASMLRLRWEIAADELGEARARSTRAPARRTPRIRAVDPRGQSSAG